MSSVKGYLRSMKGLELSEAYYNEYGRRMIENDFPHLAGFLAAGLCGSGSECFGYDDGVSRDHDFEPGFILFVPDEDVVGRRDFFELERAYSRLPLEFMGLERQKVAPAGGARRGVVRISDFLTAKTGLPRVPESFYEWFSVPEFSLAETVNGKIFEDRYGLVTSVREKLSDMPRDVRLKKLAGKLWLAGQAAPYNYQRCIRHGETGAAQLAMFEFADNVSSVVFLMNRKYRPFYKWSFRAMREFEVLGDISHALESLISSGNTVGDVAGKLAACRGVLERVIDGLKELSLVSGGCDDPGRAAFEVNGKIEDASLRNENILFGV